MSTIYTDRDADLREIEGCSLSVVGYGNLKELKEQHAGPGIRTMEADLHRRLGPGIRGGN